MLASQWPLHKSALQTHVNMKAPFAWETETISCFCIVNVFPHFRIHVLFKTPYWSSKIFRIYDYNISKTLVMYRCIYLNYKGCFYSRVMLTCFKNHAVVGIAMCCVSIIVIIAKSMVSTNTLVTFDAIALNLK